MGLRREFLEDLMTLKRLGALDQARRVIIRMLADGLQKGLLLIHGFPRQAGCNDRDRVPVLGVKPGRSQGTSGLFPAIYRCGPTNPIR